MREICYDSCEGMISSSNTGENSNYFLYTGSWYWTISPRDFINNTRSRGIDVGSVGGIYFSYSSEMGGVRPVASLPSCVVYASGEGSTNDPYLITS